MAKGTRCLTLLQEQDIVRKYRDGCPTRVIVESAPCSQSVVFQVLNKYGLPRRGPGPGVYCPTPEEIEKAATGIRRGWSEKTRIKRTVTKSPPFTVPIATVLSSRNRGTI